MRGRYVVKEGGRGLLAQLVAALAALPDAAPDKPVGPAGPESGLKAQASADREKGGGCGAAGMAVAD